MSHFLSTVNREASDAIQPKPDAPRVPDVGEIVIYHMRHGHARQGRTRFPALVQGVNERGMLQLTVILEAGELQNVSLVGEIGPGGDEGHVWERPDNSALAETFRGTVVSLHQRIGELEADMKLVSPRILDAVEANTALRKMILGDYNPPPVALFEIFAKLEGRLKEVEAYLEPLKGAADKPAKAKRK